MGPMEANTEMNMDIPLMFKWLNSNPGYKELFEKAYPGEPIDAPRLSKAIASFERTIVSNDSAFDHWLQGDVSALTQREVRGFRVFTDPNKARCSVCHEPPNFTEMGSTTSVSRPGVHRIPMSAAMLKNRSRQ